LRVNQLAAVAWAHGMAVARHVGSRPRAHWVTGAGAAAAAGVVQATAAAWAGMGVAGEAWAGATWGVAGL
jgi:hypothetical protein